MLKVSRNLISIGLALILSLLIFSGCSKLKRKGTPTANENPVIFFANIPSDSSLFSANPTVYWYATDIDGWIERYQYVMVKDSATFSFGGPDGFINDFLKNIGVDEWRDTLQTLGYFVKDTLITQDKIRMYASLNPDSTIGQYIFVRAVDDDKAVSNIIYRYFLRKNHAPKTYVEFDSKTWNFCLPETTELWKGISISWSGSDSLDYPGKQPEFEYRWELLGPFPDTNINKITVTSPLADSSWDTLSQSRFVTATTRIFVNLENASGKKFGWYLFRVYTRDDAFVLADNPATAFIRVVKPIFPYVATKSVLLIDATQTYEDYYGGSGAPKDSTQTRTFYRQILTNLQAKGVIEEWKLVGLAQAAPKPPAETTMASYKLVIITNDNALSSGNTDSCMTMYKRYLDIGGKVWMIGLNNFYQNMGSEGWYQVVGPSDLLSFNPPLFRELAQNYFHLTAVYSQGWKYGPPEGSSRNENFVGVTPYGENSLELPACEIDTSKLIYYRDYTEPDTGFFYYNYIPAVNVFALDVAKATRVYSFVSYLGEASDMHGRPVGLITIGPAGGKEPIYKCAEFCFPLFPLKQDQAELMMEKVIQNFFWVPLNP